MAGDVGSLVLGCVPPPSYPEDEEGGSVKGQLECQYNEIFCPFKFYEAHILSSVKFR